MTCHHCRAENAVDTMFCLKCGTPLNASKLPMRPEFVAELPHEKSVHPTGCATRLPQAGDVV